MNKTTMKHVLVGVLILIVSGCGRRDEVASSERILEQGRLVSGKLMVSLKGNLLTTLETGGPDAAIEVCHQDATVITEETAAADSGILALRRVSPRWRNPSNRPDGLDRATWRLFEESDLQSADGPEDLLVPDPDRDDRVVYYRALRTAPLCLTCHGSAEQIPATVKTLLAERYPDDRATGYSEGELRGLIRIDFDPQVVARSDEGS